MEDIKLGRELAATCYTVQLVAGTPAVVAGADPNRTRIAISTNSTGGVYVSFLPMVGSVLNGFNLTTANPLFVFTVEEWGKLIQGPVTCAPLVGTPTVSVAVMSLERQK